MTQIPVSGEELVHKGSYRAHIAGSITCIRPNGCSVVDYFAVSQPLHSLVNYMKVLSFTQYSDHKPLSMALSSKKLIRRVSKSIESSYEPAPSRFIFDADSKSKFEDIQQDEQFIKQFNDIHDMLHDVKNGHADSKRPNEINEMYTKYIHNMATLCFKSTIKSNNRKKNNNPWFNWQCRIAKRELNKAARSTSKFPTSDFLRLNYYKVKKSYKHLTKKHKDQFFNKMNSDIENGKILNWKQFKRLKSRKSDKTEFDCHDMNNFENFFKALYSDEHKTIDSELKHILLDTADKINCSKMCSPILNTVISVDEVKHSVTSLKSGKASSLDMINNEILKSLNSSNLDLLTDLFNACFESGSYPWNANVITPLHKKGCLSDPDNYRAIAVSSVLGKLFSTILLDRLIKFRNLNCPDPPNQLGFTKKAQTYDHILTMQTIASKYQRARKNVYAIFVDFRKAFDSVCRQALLYKLAQNGITGKFFDVLKNMYTNSYAHIKMSGHLSKKFDIKKGTEQGHPLSPDLFKLFINDLSPILEVLGCPKLSNISISHLLWADDLILLSLDPKTAKKQFDRLKTFCKDWGIEINELKTKVIIFGKEQYNCSNSILDLEIDGKPLKIDDSYCYLGIILHKSGSLKPAIDSLRTKSMRSLFGLKRIVNRSKLSFRSLTTLFDSLIKPIILYGAPMWTPTLPIIKNLSAAILSKVKNIIPKINRNPLEKVHQSFLKWALGVHRKSSNIGVWGESGRYPLIYQAIKLTLDYYHRITNLSHDKFVYAALQEQKSLNLPWYRNIESLLKIDETFNQDHVTAFQFKLKSAKTPPQLLNLIPTTSPNYTQASLTLLRNLSHLKALNPLPSRQYDCGKILKLLKEHFKECWEFEKSKSPKLLYYHSIKSNFHKENYLDDIKNSAIRYRTTRLRISAHDLEIESGRYSNTPRENRVCKWCNLTLAINKIESETHMLYDCDLYADLRTKLIETLNQSHPTYNSPISLNINHNNLVASQHTLMILLSPNVVAQYDNDNPLSYHHQPPNDDKCHLQTLRSYIINAIGSFIANCIDKRWSFIADSKAPTMTMSTA